MGTSGESIFLKGLFNMIIGKNFYCIKDFCECLQMFAYPFIILISYSYAKAKVTQNDRLTTC